MVRPVRRPVSRGALIAASTGTSTAAAAGATVVFRIGLAIAHSLQDQSYGSTLAPGRWHSLRLGLGPRRVIYAASSRALAQLEKRLHANGIAPIGQALFRLSLPGKQVVAHAADIGLPKDWRRSDAISQAFGDRWLDAGDALALWVPSYVEPSENNLLINAEHPALAQIKLLKERDPFEFDPRLA
jgi:RES domain-containing protein